MQISNLKTSSTKIFEMVREEARLSTIPATFLIYAEIVDEIAGSSAHLPEWHTLLYLEFGRRILAKASQKLRSRGWHGER